MKEYMNMSEALVLSEIHGAVVLLVLNRPEQRNALSRAMVGELSDAFSRLLTDAGARAVVITGAGKAFCSGMDLKEAEISGRGEDAEGVAISDAQALADLFQQVHTFPKPTIAAMNGFALAGGAGLATSCDFVLAAEGASLGYPEVKRGLVAAMVLYDLTRQVGERRARGLLLGGESIEAAEAERWGLINKVVAAEELREEALSLARSLTGGGPRAIATIKTLLDEAGGRPVDLRGAGAVSAAVRVSDEAREGMRAFLEKRVPRWVDVETIAEG